MSDVAEMVRRHKRQQDEFKLKAKDEAWFNELSLHWLKKALEEDGSYLLEVLAVLGHPKEPSYGN